MIMRIFGLLILILFVVFLVLPPSQKVGAICGAFRVVAGGIVSVTNNASEYTNHLNNGASAARFGSLVGLKLDEMNTACHEKVREAIELMSDPNTWGQGLK